MLQSMIVLNALVIDHQNNDSNITELVGVLLGANNHQNIIRLRHPCRGTQHNLKELHRDPNTPYTQSGCRMVTQEGRKGRGGGTREILHLTWH